MRALIIEDERKLSAFLKKSLQAECFAVDIADTGDDGLRLAQINEYDLIILDNQLPDALGIELCKTLRENGCSMPIMLLSVNDQTETKITALNNGADDYLTKPYSLKELVARIRALLRRRPVVEGDVLTLDTIMLDTQRHVVTRDENEIPLTRKEFMLLEYLMRHRGTVLSRGMIMEHVWDMNADPFSNTIESHILSLRKKLGMNKKQDVIKTVPGLGYKIE